MCSRFKAARKAKAARRRAGLFIAVSDAPMNWADAKAWSETCGGRLPLIGGSDILRLHDRPPSGTPIEGFGAKGAIWPAGLPSGYCWTGTVCADIPGNSWIVFGSGGYVDVAHVSQCIQCRAACVP